MAKRNRCSCIVTPGSGLEVTGTGTETDPYVLSGTGEGLVIAGTVGANASLTVTGAGTEDDPLVISGQASMTQAAPNIQMFTSPGQHQWVRPASATMLTVTLVGGGGGGCSGTTFAPAMSKWWRGEGGEGGGLLHQNVPVQTALGSADATAVTVIVGAGGKGGEAGYVERFTSDWLDGVSQRPLAGGYTGFGPLIAGGGRPGNASRAEGTDYEAEDFFKVSGDSVQGPVGGKMLAEGAAAPRRLERAPAGGGGAGGAGGLHVLEDGREEIDWSDFGRNGQAGGVGAAAGGAAGAADGAAGAKGADGVIQHGTVFGGGGGGGGAPGRVGDHSSGTTATAGGKGGDGGWPGGGGGAGGTGGFIPPLNGTTHQPSGAGGKGGNGVAIIVAW